MRSIPAEYFAIYIFKKLYFIILISIVTMLLLVGCGWVDFGLYIINVAK